MKLTMNHPKSSDSTPDIVRNRQPGGQQSSGLRQTQDRQSSSQSQARAPKTGNKMIITRNTTSISASTTNTMMPRTMSTTMTPLMMTITTTPAIEAEARETDKALKEILEKMGL